MMDDRQTAVQNRPSDMQSDNPFWSTLKWIAVGVVIGFALMMAVNALRGTYVQQNDEALDEQARHQGVR
jgi:hypothetical protein